MGIPVEIGDDAASLRQPRAMRRFLVGAMLLAMACCPGKLSRPEAAQHIQRTPGFNPAYRVRQIDSNDVACGIKARLFMHEHLGPLNLTMNGQAEFSRIRVDSDGSIWLHYAKPSPRQVVEITGITDPALELGSNASSLKLVHFAYRWTSEAPPAWKACVGDLPLSFGNALFRLYDDGWRVERFE